MTRLEEVTIELTLKFIGGRRPTNKEMIEVEKLRDELSELQVSGMQFETHKLAEAECEHREAARRRDDERAR